MAKASILSVKSSKDRIWSAVTDALLGGIQWSERKAAADLRFGGQCGSLEGSLEARRAVWKS